MRLSHAVHNIIVAAIVIAALVYTKDVLCVLLAPMLIERPPFDHLVHNAMNSCDAGEDAVGESSAPIGFVH